jgi:hypothetical protein
MTGAQPRPLDGSEEGEVTHTPLWRPAGKVAGRWLPAYVGEERQAASDVPDEAVRIALTASDVRAANPEWLFDLSEPVHPNAPEIRRLGSLMHDLRRDP